ncbi:glycosyltransferase [Oceanicoccus sp. KOV_DT_Chl]|uniref:glycosyltransferase n=1 Tax=Oceanicoccus sp. KOV_DT_Chl TaxID=1904639 RepID=UPI001F3861EF|nr:glycosyltransferase [Oceanicoccus sp. KOV_DT_Chl]
MLEIIFWTLLLLSAYSYFIYPVILILLIKMKPTLTIKEQPASPFPNLTLIITAHNEASRIREKLDNSLELTYPEAQLEIIVASDCSDDGTDDIVNEYSNKGIKLVRATERLGKEHAQLCAIQQASGDVIVFSDTATQIPEDALSILGKYFTDPTIGSVSSEDRVLNQNGEVAGEGAYVKYEMWLRQLESKLAGLVGLSGSFFAARKIICETWDIHSPSDFNTALNTAANGYASISAPDVLGYYQDLSDPAKNTPEKRALSSAA